jgi:hypothetical protein
VAAASLERSSMAPIGTHCAPGRTLRRLLKRPSFGSLKAISRVARVPSNESPSRGTHDIPVLVHDTDGVWRALTSNLEYLGRQSHSAAVHSGPETNAWPSITYPTRRTPGRTAVRRCLPDPGACGCRNSPSASQPRSNRHRRSSDASGGASCSEPIRATDGPPRQRARRVHCCRSRGAAVQLSR